MVGPGGYHAWGMDPMTRRPPAMLVWKVVYRDEHDDVQQFTMYVPSNRVDDEVWKDARRNLDRFYPAGRIEAVTPRVGGPGRSP